MGLLDMLSDLDPASYDPLKGNPDAQQALLAAGLGILAANQRGMSAGNVIGQGGLLGLQAYGQAQQAREARADEALKRQGMQIDIETKQQALDQAKAFQGLLGSILGGADTTSTATPKEVTESTAVASPATSAAYADLPRFGYPSAALSSPSLFPAAPSGAASSDAPLSVSETIAPDVSDTTSTGVPGTPPLPPMSTLPGAGAGASAGAGAGPINPPLPRTMGGGAAPTPAAAPATLPTGLGFSMPGAGPQGVSIAAAASVKPGSATAGALVPTMQGTTTVNPLSAAGSRLAQRISSMSPDMQTAVISDIAFNSGKGLPALLKPDVIVADNGLIYDKSSNKVIGSMPKVNSDGSASMLTTDDQGNFSVKLLPGSDVVAKSIAQTQQNVKDASDMHPVIDTKTGDTVLRSTAEIKADPARWSTTGQSPLVTYVDTKTGETRTTTQQTQRNAIGGQPVIGPDNKPVDVTVTAPSPTATAATNALNDSFIKNDYEPVQKAGAAAINTLATTQVLRPLIKGTGFSTPAKAQLSAWLDGLGLHTYAADANIAQRFNSIAGAQVFDTLRQQAGVQTEGDAQRAAKLYASLGNTPQANAFILDYQEALANQALLRQQFYDWALQRLPTGGRMSDITGQWNKYQAEHPLMSQKVMQRWVVGGQ